MEGSYLRKAWLGRVHTGEQTSSNVTSQDGDPLTMTPTDHMRVTTECDFASVYNVQTKISKASSNVMKS